MKKKYQSPFTEVQEFDWNDIIVAGNPREDDPLSIYFYL